MKLLVVQFSLVPCYLYLLLLVEFSANRISPISLLVTGRYSVVGIATRYELDGPGIESRWGRDFHHPSRPVLGPTRLPVQWVPGHSRV
jgi:hypothetical protein